MLALVDVLDADRALLDASDRLAAARMFEDNRSLFTRHLDRAEPAAGLAALIDAYLSEERLPGWGAAVHSG